jgi:hypothetical protein
MEWTHFDKLVAGFFNCLAAAKQILVLFVYKAFKMHSFFMFSAGGALAGEMGGNKGLYSIWA